MIAAVSASTSMTCSIFSFLLWQGLALPVARVMIRRRCCVVALNTSIPGISIQLHSGAGLFV